MQGHKEHCQATQQTPIDWSLDKKEIDSRGAQMLWPAAVLEQMSCKDAKQTQQWEFSIPHNQQRKIARMQQPLQCGHFSVVIHFGVVIQMEQDNSSILIWREDWFFSHQGIWKDSSSFPSSGAATTNNGACLAQ